MGSLSGEPGSILYGAVVDGPSLSANFDGLSTPNGANKCSNSHPSYDGNGVKFQDNVSAWPSAEPADDYTVVSLLAFAKMSIQ